MTNTTDFRKEKTYNLNILFDYSIIVVLYIRELLLLIIGESGITTFFFYLFIVLVSGLVVKGLFVFYKIINSPVFLLALIVMPVFVAYISYTSLIALSKEGIDSIGLIVFSLLIFYLYTYNQEQNIGILKLNTYFNLVMAFLLFVFSFFSFSHSEFGLVYNYINPNSTGLYALLTFYNITIGKKYLKNIFNAKVLDLGMYACLYVLVLSKSRSAIGALLFFLLFYFLISKGDFEKSKSLLARLLFILQFFVIFFPFVWSSILLDSGLEVDVFAKPLLSFREIIWDYMITVIKENPYASHLGEGVEYGSGPHNVFLGIWWNYGLIPYVCIIIILFLFFRKKLNDCKTKTDILTLLTIVSLYISMSFECLMISGGINFTFRAFYLSSFIGFLSFQNNTADESSLAKA